MRFATRWTTAALLLCTLPAQAADAQRSTYHIAPDSNRLTATTGSDPASFTHDANGNITAWSLGGHANTVTYDVMNRPARHVRNGVATDYEYDAFDRRVGKSSATGGQQRFVYDGHRLLAEADSLGRWTNYVWLGNELVALIRGGQMYAVHTDHLGRPEVVTDAHKAVVWLAVYGAFDRKVLVDMIGGLNIGFPGQYHDLESGLAHNGRRDYVPEIGRYLQTDPIGLAGGLNTYAYANSNPVSRVDPDGLDDLHMALLYGGVTQQYPERRLPDYVGVDASFGLGKIGYVLTRNGTVFAGGGFGTDVRAPLATAGKFGFSLYAGKLDKCVPAEGVDRFIAGRSHTFGGAYGLSASRTYNDVGSATNIGIGTPGVTIESTFYGPAHFTKVGW